VRYRYYSDCVHWPRNDVHHIGGLTDMVNSDIQVCRRTLLRNVGRELVKELETSLGYPIGRRSMASYCDVSYWRGKLHGDRVYWVTWSAIEHVFIPDGE